MKDWVYYALALIELVGLPLMSTFVASMVHELRRGNDHGMPLRAWFAVGFASAAILILAVILLKLDAFFPELGDTFGVSACAFAGIVFSVLAPIGWLKFLKQEDSQQTEWLASNMPQDRPLREWEVTDPDPTLHAALVKMNAQQAAQSASFGKHAAKL